jgi:hypothetical protein
MVSYSHRRRAQLLAAGLAGATLLRAHALPPGEPWTLRPPIGDPVVYRGNVDHERVRGISTGGAPYPAANVGGLVGAVLVHAVISEGAKKVQLERLQTEADAVLQPLRRDLATITHSDLMQLALARLPGSGGALGAPDRAYSGWQVSSAPVFVMMPDRRALLLDNTIEIFAPGETAKPAYAVTVRVVSAPRTEPDPLATWLAPDAVRQESSRMVAHSLAVALRDSARSGAGEAASFRTIRYLQGQEEKMERGQPIEAWCQRQVLRTLRGWLLSVPLAATEPEPPCERGELAPS